MMIILYLLQKLKISWALVYKAISHIAQGIV